MSLAVQALTEQNDLLRQQVSRYSDATDRVSARLADALNRLRPHDPDYVAQALGEPKPAAAIADAGPDQSGSELKQGQFRAA